MNTPHVESGLLIRQVRGCVCGALLLAGLFHGCTTAQMQQFGDTIKDSIQINDPNHLLDAGGELVKAVTPLNEEQEYYLGRGVAAAILSRYQPVESPALVAYVNRVGAVVVAASSRPEVFGGYHVEVLDTPEINAISAPGGFIFVTRGLLDRVATEDELASILAHEVGHIALAHGIGAISRAHLTEALSIIGRQMIQPTAGDLDLLTAAFGKSLGDVVTTVLTTGYSRSQEFDADRYSLTVLANAGFRQDALVAMLQMVDVAGTTGSATNSGWFATHPPAADRIAKARPAIRTTAVGDDLRTQRFRKATGRKG